MPIWPASMIPAAAANSEQTTKASTMREVDAGAEPVGARLIRADGAQLEPGARAAQQDLAADQRDHDRGDERRPASSRSPVLIAAVMSGRSCPPAAGAAGARCPGPRCRRRATRAPTGCARRRTSSADHEPRPRPPSPITATMPSIRSPVPWPVVQKNDVTTDDQPHHRADGEVEVRRSASRPAARG